jgi:hypothetical protein
MKVAFTTATINYLPRACTLAHSFLDHHPEYRFIVFLIDPKTKKTEPFKRENLDFISIEDLEINELTELVKNLNISEISFSLKPILAEYIFEHFPKTSLMFYFDGDIRVYQRLDAAEALLKKSDLLLTPHFTHAVEDDKIPSELDILRTGIYNMGFAGFRNAENTKSILSWWKNRVLNFGYENHDLGLTADQMWMSLAPLFFENVAIIKNPGYNFAYWNIHERHLNISDDEFLINDTEKLVFVHFADFDPDRPELFSNPKHFNRVQPGENFALQKLCKNYADELKQNHLDEYNSIKSKFAISYRKQAWQNLFRDKQGSKMKSLAIWYFYLYPGWLRRFLRRFSLFILRNIK